MSIHTATARWKHLDTSPSTLKYYSQGTYPHRYTHKSTNTLQRTHLRLHLHIHVRSHSRSHPHAHPSSCLSSLNTLPSTLLQRPQHQSFLDTQHHSHLYGRTAQASFSTTTQHHQQSDNTQPPASASTSRSTTSAASASTSSVSHDSKVRELNIKNKSQLGDKIYISPFQSTLRIVKRLSLTSCILSIISSPVLLALSPANVPITGTASMCAVIVTFGIGTTVALSQFSKGYITNLYLPKHQTDVSSSSDNSNQRIIAETLNVYARPRYRSLPIKYLSSIPYDGTIPMMSNLFVNAPGSEKHKFFVHEHLATHPTLKHLYETHDDPNETTKISNTSDNDVGRRTDQHSHSV